MYKPLPHTGNPAQVSEYSDAETGEDYTYLHLFEFINVYSETFVFGGVEATVEVSVVLAIVEFWRLIALQKDERREFSDLVLLYQSGTSSTNKAEFQSFLYTKR